MSANLSAEPPPTTREKLIHAAFRVVARDGLAEANVKAIAAEAGITPGLLHYHFASKDALLEAAVALGTENYLAELDELIAGHEPAEVLSAYVAFAQGALEAHRDLFRVRLALAVRAMNDADLSARLEASNTAVRARVARILAFADGRPVPSAKDELRARMIKATFEGMMLAWLSQPDFPMEAAMAEWIELMRTSIAASQH